MFFRIFLMCVFLTATIAYSVTGEGKVEIRIIENAQPLSYNIDSPAASCDFDKSDGTISSYVGNLSIGYQVVTYYDPIGCGEIDTYPFQINSFSFTLYDDGYDVNWPVTIDVVIYEEDFQGNRCLGPGMEVCRQTVICEEPIFAYPNMGTVTLENSCCVSRPFFAGIEYIDGQERLPSIIYDGSAPVDTCDNWFYSTAAEMWMEWYWIWGPPTVGYPIFQVNGETDSDLCACFADGDVNNDGMTLTVADYVYLVRYLEGSESVPPEPCKADINGDCVIDQLDADLYADYFEYGYGVFDPYGLPIETCCTPDTVTGASCGGYICRQLSEENCIEEGGDYRGDGTRCNPLSGDANGDEMVNIGDGVFLVNFFFGGGSEPPSMANADPNGDCCVDYADLAFYACMGQVDSELEPDGCTCPDTDVCLDNLRRPGDANGDGSVNVADAVYMISYVFKGGPGPVPYAVYSGDANNDGEANLGDAVFLISYVFSGGPEPASTMDWINTHPCLHPDGYIMQ